MLRRLLAVLLSVVLVGLVAPPAGADTLDDLAKRQAAAEKRKAAADDTIESLEHDLEDTDQEMADAYVRLTKVRADLDVAQAALDVAEAELTSAETAAKKLADRLADAQSEEAALVTKIEEQVELNRSTKSSIAELARRAYRGEGAPDSMSLVVGAESATDFVNRFSLSQTALRVQTNTLTDLQESEATARNSQVRLEAVRETVADLKTEADAAVVVAEKARATASSKRAAVADLLSKEKADLAVIEKRKQAQLDAKDKAEQASSALANDIQDIIGLTKKEKDRIRKEKAAARKKAEEEARKKAEKDKADGKPSTPSPPTSDPKPPAGKGFFAYPTKVPHITSSYGYRLHPVLGYVRLHAGTDFRAYCGTPIYAAAAGKVVWAQYRGGFGNQVLINHGEVGGRNLMSSYNHFSRFAVSSGERVSKGQIVGYSGNTGTSTACHLHFEVYVDGQTVDPMSML
ncbi:peptidoglycan DD-metalloendopeptidase family protein [Flavimobilis sp. GY10621]|uniref:Peptidoglycan DD-metalloendopeptidase family protein n=1 Tax=Flavimobilis rhizosphaerae TaxID=2775421 RepID=A0ABR9DPM3_9MICO|nr:M23 family metallopeptidase [Flavimobilis rhizosphaerae]MBD9699068.1 peptidoglycan DD-metalloendopeptidase family protein [Flavimobilis rhizosphaerae]